MRYVVGLGNPGEQYRWSRHNVGFMVIDALATRLQASWNMQNKFSAEVARHQDTFLVKPQTYMNDSGQALAALLHFYKEKAAANGEWPNIFIIHDDLDIELGQYKLQFGKGPKIHNGVNSINDHVHTEMYWHVRIGVDSRQGDRSVDAKEYVLAPFAPHERPVIEHVISQVVDDILPQL